MSKKEQDTATIIDIRDRVLAKLKFEKDGTVTKPDPKELAKVFEESLPEGLDIKQVNAVHNHEALFVAGVAATATAAAAPILNENKDVASVNYEVPTHNKGKVQVMATRNNLDIAVVTVVANPKAGHLQSQFESYLAALDSSIEATE